jgi:hypothetical protein
VIGLLSDSHGDLDAFDRAYRLLKERGARRFFFAGGRYSDLDEWVTWRNKQASGGNDYTDTDFLADVSSFLCGEEQVERPPAFGLDPNEGDPEMVKVKERFVRTPEHDSPQYGNPGVEVKAMDMLGDALCTLVHDKNDLTRDDMLNAVVFIHGKERQPKVVQIGPRFFVTPGMLTGAPEQTCALIEVPEREKVLRFSAFTLEGRTVIDQQPLPLGGGKTKISVK